jgi:hypothetical protein
MGITILPTRLDMVHHGSHFPFTKKTCYGLKDVFFNHQNPWYLWLVFQGTEIRHSQTWGGSHNGRKFTELVTFWEFIGGDLQSMAISGTD